MAIVEFENVSRVYRNGEHEQRALDHVNLSLEEGQFIVILGPSGAGKSTLLNLLGGLDSPTEGTIRVNGKDISTLTANELAEYRAASVGFVFQSYNLGIMSYTERYREMATLKVVGFRDSRIGRLLISQNLWLTVIGIAIGIPAGAGVLQYLLTALASEYELKLVLGPATWLVSVLLTFGVSLAVGLMISRKNRTIDMVAALKTEE